MNPETQNVLVLATIVALIMLVSFTIGFICLFFPKRCDKCGKSSAFKSVKSDRSEIYTAGGYIISVHYISQKTCVSCGFISPPKLERKLEFLAR